MTFEVPAVRLIAGNGDANSRRSTWGPRRSLETCPWGMCQKWSAPIGINGIMLEVEPQGELDSFRHSLPNFQMLETWCRIPCCWNLKWLWFFTSQFGQMFAMGCIWLPLNSPWWERCIGELPWTNFGNDSHPYEPHRYPRHPTPPRMGLTQVWETPMFEGYVIHIDRVHPVHWTSLNHHQTQAHFGSMATFYQSEQSKFDKIHPHFSHILCSQPRPQRTPTCRRRGVMIRHSPRSPGNAL